MSVLATVTAPGTITETGSADDEQVLPVQRSGAVGVTMAVLFTVDPWAALAATFTVTT